MSVIKAFWFIFNFLQDFHNVRQYQKSCCEFSLQERIVSCCKLFHWIFNVMHLVEIIWEKKQLGDLLELISIDHNVRVRQILSFNLIKFKKKISDLRYPLK